ncbi:MAG: hypothetical protein ABIP87_06980 [Thermomonas sp.]
MDAERWQRLSPLLDALLELSAEQRSEHLAALRREDSRLADELQHLLTLEADDEDFLAEPVVEMPNGARPGARIGPYRLERLIGEGGMGQVWLAARADGLYERNVALKLLRPGLIDPRLRQRFDREREILARFAHPYISACWMPASTAMGNPSLPWNTSMVNPSPPIVRRANWTWPRALICSARSAKQSATRMPT